MASVEGAPSCSWQPPSSGPRIRPSTWEETMPGRLEEKDWTNLLQRIRDKKCTPFVGAGACAGTLPLAWQIARQWAERYNYPLTDSTDLARVSQFLAIDQDDD